PVLGPDDRPAGGHREDLGGDPADRRAVPGRLPDRPRNQAPDRAGHHPPQRDQGAANRGRGPDLQAQGRETADHQGDGAPAASTRTGAGVSFIPAAADARVSGRAWPAAAASVWASEAAAAYGRGPAGDPR